MTALAHLLAAVLLCAAPAVTAQAAQAARQPQLPPPPPPRPRASGVRLATQSDGVSAPRVGAQPLKKGEVGAQPGPDLEVECAMRSVAYDMSQRHPAARRHASTIHASLQMDQCPGAAAAAPVVSAPDEPAPCADGRHWSSCSRPAQPAGGKTFWVDCANGDDTHAGTKAAPFATVTAAQTASRAAGAGTQVFLRAGTCYLKSTLLLTAADSGVHWSSFDNEAVVLSGGASLSGIKWSQYKNKIMVADLPDGVNASAIDSLFTVPAGGPGGEGATRHVRARYPNGDSELDRMPTNYDKLGGGAGATQSWVAAGAKSERFPSVIRNSSFYPSFGHSNDLRWVLE
jgi:hypothetical protein